MFLRNAPRELGPLFCCIAMLAAPAVAAGVVIYEEGDKSIEIGGRVQIQYEKVDPDGGQSTDSLFFRRLRPYVKGTVTEDWSAKIQFDFGEADGSNEVAIKDAFIQYSGSDRGKLTIGNVKPGFSRQFLTSSKYQQVVERGFAGDHNFGTPDRAIVVKWDGHAADKKVTYSLAGGVAHHDPDEDKVDFDSPAVNRSDWNEGLLFVGRLDVHPRGFMKFDRGDFDRSQTRYNLSVAAFGWQNDDDNNANTNPVTGMDIGDGAPDLDSASGFELSAGLRSHGWSLDGEYQMISGDTVDPAFNGGLYVNGTTDLDKLSFNGGYMVVDHRVELVAAWDAIDADGYMTEWTRTSVGVNLFANEHNAKLQLTYQMGQDVDGVSGVDEDAAYAQAQFVF